jgi:hypothetical protein
MSSIAKNIQKKNRRNLRKFYTFYFSVALLVCGILFLLLLASLLWIIHIDTEIALFLIIVIIVLFLPFSLYLKSNNKNRILKIPSYMSEKGLKNFRNATIIFFILVFAYGILVYPYMPIRSDANLFTDKIGKVYSYSEFMNFKKWEITFIISWGIFALQGFVSLPFLDTQTRKCWKF